MEPDEAKIVRAVFRLSRRLRGVASDGDVTSSGMVLLITLAREGPKSAVALARSEGLQPQSLSRLLNKLDGDGLIRRLIDPADRRRQQIELTDAGRSIAEQAMIKRRKWLAHAMAQNLSDSDRHTLLAAADIMLRIAERPEGKRPKGRLTA